MLTTWQPIETAPRNKLILIRTAKGYLPDLVRWRNARLAHGDYLTCPPGWFRPYGGRSHVTNPTEWMDIPE